ncbi:MAG: 5'/3'-nucleotidase SurE [Candidatus Zipacnadales bacterium]
MRILLANDDGIFAPGLRALAEALSDCAEVSIIAPEREQSAAGHAVTLHKPLRLTSVQFDGLAVEAYSTNGTPADCVALGTILRDSPPDLVMSGINSGANLAEEVLYSGTAAAAMEGAMYDIPSFALSVVANDRSFCFDSAARFARWLVEYFPRQLTCRACFYNVNVPNLLPEEITGIEVTRLGHRRYVNRIHECTDPRGRPYYWFMGDPLEKDASPGTDIAAVRAGRISISPLHFDLTSHADIGPLAEALRTVPPPF